MIKYTILYKNGKTWNGKAPAATSLWAFVDGVYKFKKQRKPNPASVTKKQKKFDEDYARWVRDWHLRGSSDITMQAYKKWLWEQKQAGPDGWIPWGGGKCPVPYPTEVEVKFRCGLTNKTLPAEDWDWGGGDGGHVIVAYRLLGEENKPVKYSEPKKAPIKVTYTFWLGAFGEISDE